MLQIAKVWVSL
jgi:hypothetical protein